MTDDGQQTTVKSAIQAELDDLVAKDTTPLYSEEEKEGLVDHLNSALADDESLRPGKHKYAHIPIDPKGDDLFEAGKDGLVFGHFINLIAPKSMRIRRLHEGPRLTYFHWGENCTDVIVAARRLGVNVVNIGPEDILNGNKKLVLGLLWQLVAKHIQQQVSHMLVTREAPFAWKAPFT